jgi:hypothetical protein
MRFFINIVVSEHIEHVLAKYQFSFEVVSFVYKRHSSF